MTLKAHTESPGNIESKLSINQAVSIVNFIYKDLPEDFQLRPTACFIDSVRHAPQHPDPDYLVFPTKPFQPEQNNPNRIPFDLWFIPWSSFKTFFEYSNSEVSTVLTEHQIDHENDELTYKSIFQLLSSLNRLDPILIPKSSMKIFGGLTILKFDLDSNFDATYPYMQSIQILFSEAAKSDASSLMVNTTVFKVDGGKSQSPSKSPKGNRSSRKRRRK